MPSTSVLRLIRPLRGRILLIGLLAVVGAQLEAAALVLMAPAAQAVAAGEDRVEATVGPFHLDAAVTDMAYQVMAVVVGAALVNLVVAKLRSSTVSHWEAGERDGLLTDYLHATWALQSRERSSELHQTSMWSGQAGVVVNALISAVRAGAAVAIMVGVALLIDPQTAALIVAVGGGLFLALRPLVHRIRALNKASVARSLDYGNALSEMAGLAREIRLFGATDAVDERLRGLSEHLTHTRQKAMVLQYSMQPAYQYLGLIVVAVVLLIGAGSDDLDVAAFGATALLLLRSLTFGQQLQAAYQSMAEAAPFTDRYLEARTRYRAAHENRIGVPLERVHRIRFADVHHHYDAGRPSLDGVDLELAAGTTVGIVGPSGSGKSTLAQVLLRLREPTSGLLLVDGVPATELDALTWYRRFAFVPQESHLFHGTLAENIAFFDPHVTSAQIEQAARLAGLHDVISALPDGYDTLVGTSFRDLSGGQVQRVGIARALVRDASVIVLDEPTSALDVHTEALVQESLQTLAGPDRLVVIVAHRLSTLSICDRIVVLEAGRVAGEGTIAEVAASNDFFRRAMERGVLDGGA